MEDLAHVHAAGDEVVAGVWMSSTPRTRLCAEPGLADVPPLPKMIEASELGGVNCTTRKSPPAKSASSRQPRFS